MISVKLSIENPVQIEDRDFSPYDIRGSLKEDDIKLITDENNGLTDEQRKAMINHLQTKFGDESSNSNLNDALNIHH